MTGPSVHIGVDVSKHILELSGFDRGAPQVPNTAAGIRRLIKRIKRLEPEVRVCCEATGGYEAALCTALLEAGVPIARINPGRSREYAKSRGQLAKTDRLDAMVLAAFSTERNPRLLEPPAPWRAELKALCVRRHTLVKMSVQEQNRLDPLPPAVVAKGIRAHIRHIKGRINKIEEAILKMRKSEQEIHALCTRLELIQGIGPITSVNLVALLPELGQLGGNEIVALAGLAPYNDDSAKHSGPRCIQGGRARVRASLYMGALSATLHNPVLSVFYNRLIAAGKAPKVAITAVMRKLIRLANRVVADPDFVPVNPKKEKAKELAIEELAEEDVADNPVGQQPVAGRCLPPGKSRGAQNPDVIIV